MAAEYRQTKIMANISNNNVSKTTYDDNIGEDNNNDNNCDEDNGSNDFSLIEESGLVGLFLRHEQNLDLYDWNRNGGTLNESSNNNNTTNVAGNKRTKQSKDSNETIFDRNRVRYRLNKSLFAINEPYFMKTERDSLIRYIRESTGTISSGASAAAAAAAAAALAEANSVTEDEDGNPILNETNTTTKNGVGGNGVNKKRKRNLTKKLAYIESNLANKAERLIALKLIGKYLTEQINNNNNFGGDSVGSSSSSNSSNSNSNSKINNNKKPKLIRTGYGDLDEKILLSHINSNESQSNREAQTFVNSLFRNRFESLNYRTKLFCNPFDQVLKVKFGLSNYLIPGRCSFAGVDIVEGIQMLCRYLKIASVSSSSLVVTSGNNNNKNNINNGRQDYCPEITAANLICSKNPFMIVMDPAWDRNKSVKRKRSYETVSSDYLRRMTRELATLIELVASLKSEARRLKPQQQEQQLNNLHTEIQKPEILCAIWTTKADKDFVHKEMLPMLNLRCTYELKWHKITLNGLPVKIHGGLEFLILAESFVVPTGLSSSLGLPPVSSLLYHHNHKPTSVGRRSNTNTMSSTSSSNHHHLVNTTNPPTPPPKKGILVSVPSAIHSHKPSLLPLFRQLYGIRQLTDQRYRTTVTMPTNPDDIFHYQMAPNEFLLPLSGLELFARYLTPGFHSIGHECIKLQNENLFVTTNTNSNNTTTTTATSSATAIV